MESRYNVLQRLLNTEKCFKMICGAGNEDKIQVLIHNIIELFQSFYQFYYLTNILFEILNYLIFNSIHLFFVF